jgi:hypothetical protein
MSDSSVDSKGNIRDLIDYEYDSDSLHPDIRDKHSIMISKRRRKNNKNTKPRKRISPASSSSSLDEINKKLHNLNTTITESVEADQDAANILVTLVKSSQPVKDTTQDIPAAQQSQNDKDNDNDNNNTNQPYFDEEALQYEYESHTFDKNSSDEPEYDYEDEFDEDMQEEYDEQLDDDYGIDDDGGTSSSSTARGIVLVVLVVGSGSST